MTKWFELFCIISALPYWGKKMIHELSVTDRLQISLILCIALIFATRNANPVSSGSITWASPSCKRQTQPVMCLDRAACIHYNWPVWIQIWTLPMHCRPTASHRHYALTHERVLLVHKMFPPRLSFDRLEMFEYSHSSKNECLIFFIYEWLLNGWLVVIYNERFSKVIGVY